MSNVYKVMGLRNELTDFLDEYVADKWKVDEFHVYVFDREGVPETFSNEEGTYGWYIRYPGYTCANAIFKEEDDTLIDFRLILSSAFDGNQTVFATDPDELEKMVLEKFKGKKIA